MKDMSRSTPNPNIFREYDIRGIAGRDLTKDFAVILGYSFVSLLRQHNPDARLISIGRDVRLSSPSLAAGLIEGIIGNGMDVYDIGVCPTPVQYFSIHNRNLDGGIMVTGSHNPPEYNGFKLSIGRNTIHGETIKRLQVLAVKGTLRDIRAEGQVQKFGALKAYTDYMIKEFSYLADSKYRRLKVVVDAGNGTAGMVVPELLEQMGCEVIQLYCEPDGSFPNHHPDPTVQEYIQPLIAETRRNAADIGIAYDGDADRIGVINTDGNVIWGDQLLIILSRSLLQSHQGMKVIGDVKCSQTMFDDIQQHGGIPIMWKTGHSLIKQKMRDEEALLAGEFSGHIFIADRYYGYDDAIYTTLRLIEIMKRESRNITELLDGVPRSIFTPEIRLECADENKESIIRKIVSRFLSYKDDNSLPARILHVNTLDGIRVGFEHGWGLIRMSNTQPVIVMRLEAKDEEHLALYRGILEAEFRSALEEL